MNNHFFYSRNSETRFFIALACVLLISIIVVLVISFNINREDVSRSSEFVTNPFPKVEVTAKAVYVYDIRTKTVLFAKNENTRLPLASLSKLMSALVAKDMSPLNVSVTINEEALKVYGDSGFYNHERWSLKDILDFSLIASSNDGMRAVALTLGALSRADVTSEEIISDFVLKMNNRAQELGLYNTYFLNETGLDIPLDEINNPGVMKGGAYGTAKDISVLLEYLIIHHPEILEVTNKVSLTFRSLDNHLHTAKNTNTLISTIPGLVASKTGFTDTAGGNLVLVFDPELGRPFIISILGSTEKERFRDASLLINAVMEYITKN